MKKQTKIKEGLAKSSKIALAATLLSVPMFTAMPPMGFAQKTLNSGAVSKTVSPSSPGKTHYTIKLTNANIAKIVGIQDGKTIYKNDKDEYFWLDTKTGDMKFLSSDIFIKMEASNSARTSLNFLKIKIEDDRVTILGVDEKGNVINQNRRGEKFYLDSKTGDMIFVK